MKGQKIDPATPEGKQLAQEWNILKSGVIGQQQGLNLNFNPQAIQDPMSTILSFGMGPIDPNSQLGKSLLEKAQKQRLAALETLQTPGMLTMSGSQGMVNFSYTDHFGSLDEYQKYKVEEANRFALATGGAALFGLSLTAGFGGALYSAGLFAPSLTLSERLVPSLISGGVSGLVNAGSTTAMMTMDGDIKNENAGSAILYSMGSGFAYSFGGGMLGAFGSLPASLGYSAFFGFGDSTFQQFTIGAQANSSFQDNLNNYLLNGGITKAAGQAAIFAAVNGSFEYLAAGGSQPLFGQEMIEQSKAGYAYFSFNANMLVNGMNLAGSYMNNLPKFQMNTNFDYQKWLKEGNKNLSLDYNRLKKNLGY